MNIFYNTFAGIIKILLRLSGRDKRYAEKFISRYPSLSVLYPEVLNYIHYTTNSKSSYKPVAVIIEPLNQCNLHCIQCEVNNGMKRQKGRMELSTLMQIVDKHPFIQRINLTNYGEPLLHKDIIEMISYVHNKGKFVNIITNTTLLTEDMSKRLIKSGLDMITFSVDGVDDVYEKVRKYDYKAVENNINTFLELNNKAGKPIRTEMNMVEFEPTMGQSEKLIERWGNKIDLITTAELRNTSKRTKKCLVLWRSLTVLWDGTVVPCCIDAEGTLPVGNVNEKTLDSIFNDAPIKQLRQLHIDGKFPPVCATCNEFFG